MKRCFFVCIVCVVPALCAEPSLHGGGIHGGASHVAADRQDQGLVRMGPDSAGSVGNSQPTWPVILDRTLTRATGRFILSHSIPLLHAYLHSLPLHCCLLHNRLSHVHHMLSVTPCYVILLLQHVVMVASHTGYRLVTTPSYILLIFTLLLPTTGHN